jgi:hypothetical protein
MSSVIQNLLDGVIGDGARSSKFDCLINFNNTNLFPNENDIHVLAKTSQFPGKTHEIIDLRFKGRSIPIKGQVKYDNTWTCTFYLTEDHGLKKGFEEWIESLDQQHNLMLVTNEIESAQKSNQSNYDTNLVIRQLDFTGNSDKGKMEYTLHHCFPKSVSTVDVDYSAVGTILEFTVEFSYAYYTTTNFVDDNGSFIEGKRKDIINDIQGLADNAGEKIGNAVKGIF